MSSPIDRHEITRLRVIADFRMLTYSQLSAFSGKGSRTVRRWKERLVGDDLAEVLPVSSSAEPGRPEGVLGISPGGLSVLKSEGLLDKRVAFEQVSGRPLLQQAGHQILLNWVRLHGTRCTQILPRMEFRFFSCNSPFHFETGNNTPLIRDWVPGEDDGAAESNQWFVPDGVFVFSDTEQKKSLLFLLEVDMDSEPLDSSKPNQPTILKKIQTYQAYFESGRYKRYEETFQTPLNGFRLLFVTGNPRRFLSICQTVLATPPSNFIWITHQDTLFEQGISGDIWAPGGRHSETRKSILGSLGGEAPIPELRQN